VILYDAASVGTANYLNMAKEILQNNDAKNKSKTEETKTNQ
jgi:hypothetical protein